MLDLQQARDERVAAGLLDYSVSGVDQDDARFAVEAPVTMLRVY